MKKVSSVVANTAKFTSAMQEKRALLVITNE